LLRINEQLKNAENIIALNNPERQLKLGYSIATVAGKIIRKTSDVKVGQNLEVKVVDGVISSEIKEVNKN
jgi:exonuclease VII large subunit